MGNIRFKVGDRVRIKSLDWYKQMLSIPNKLVWQNKLTNDFVGIWCSSHIFKESMFEFLGKTMTIQEVGIDFYLMEEDTCGYEFNDEMIEGLVEETKFGTASNPIEPKSNANSITQSEVDVIEKAKNYWDSIKDAWICPEGYQFVDENGNVINATKIVLEKKKKEYPKTYEECCKILGFLNVDLCFNADYRSFDASKEQWKRLGLMNQFYQLLICRDAYWKIAGEEMGLGKPWEPNWGKGACYTICCNTNQIVIGTDKFRNSILTFPTEEMRDAFFENFKEFINEVKELL